MNMLCFMDGELLEQDQVKISMNDRGYYFGDGVYEVIKIYGGELYTANEHLSRLFESAEKIKLTIPYSLDQLIQTVRQLVTKNNLIDGHVYIQVTRGVAPRTHHFPNPEVPAIVTAYTVSSARPVLDMENGVSVKSVDDIRWLRCDIKSLNLLGSVLAKQEAHEANCFEALLHREGVVTEGSSTNMFGIKNGEVYTHPANNLILNGITRQVVLRICDELGIPVVEKPFTLEEAFEMDEFFLTSTTSEVMPVVKIDGQIIGEGAPGAITRRLQQAFKLQIPAEIKDAI